MITGISERGYFALSVRSTSSPLMSGMQTSRSMTSGEPLRAMSSPVLPSVAKPTSNRPVFSRPYLSVSHRLSSSSINSTLNFMAISGSTGSLNAILILYYVGIRILSIPHYFDFRSTTCRPSFALDVTLRERGHGDEMKFTTDDRRMETTQDSSVSRTLAASSSNEKGLWRKWRWSSRMPLRAMTSAV